MSTIQTGIKWPKLMNNLKPLLSKKDNKNVALSEFNHSDLPE